MKGFLNFEEKKMIQRIQSLYFIGVVVLISMMFFFPLASFYDDSGAFYQLFGKGLLKFDANVSLIIERNSVLMVLKSLIVLLTAIIILYYKNRRLQVRFCWILLTMLILLFGLNFFFYKRIIVHYSFVRYNMSLIASMPLISIILTYLAIIRIKKDEDLVKSADRLR
jgi:hypothetical protein